jgi:trk system potassium uptake protein TrkH
MTSIFGKSRVENIPLRQRINPARIFVLGFIMIILFGALLLALPISSRGGVPIPFPIALFTATSATCVTGLVMADTALTWSVFGRAVILCLIQIGALGFMSVTTIFFFIMNRKINLSQRLLLVHSLNLHDRNGIVGLVRHVLFGTLIFEGAGAAILWIRFMPEYGALKGLGMGVFHSVSAFCNAGFDLMGHRGAFSSLTTYAHDPVITVTTMLLVIVGGLGFFVWEDLWRNRSFQKLHLHSKMVLSVSLALILSGWILFYFAERENTGTIGNMPFPRAALASLYQSVMPRSGGFSTINQASLTGISKMATLVLMFIGGSAGSAAGGIKNVTAGILFLTAVYSLMGKKRLTVFKRTIPETQIVSALSIMVLVLSVCFAGTAAIALIQPELPIAGIVFEMVSAVATCGLSNGITPSLSVASSGIIIVSMFFGRVGIMTVGMAAFLRRNNAEKVKYPDTWVMM